MPREEEEDSTDSSKNAATELRYLLLTNSTDSLTTLEAEKLKGITRKHRLPLMKLSRNTRNFNDW